MSSQRRYFLCSHFSWCLCASSAACLAPAPGAVGCRSATSSTPSDEDLKASIESFTKVYDVVDENYADKLSADKAIYKGAIPGMLRTLDPHSNFFDPKEFAGLARRAARQVLRRRHADWTATADGQDDGHRTRLADRRPTRLVSGPATADRSE